MADPAPALPDGSRERSGASRLSPPGGALPPSLAAEGSAVRKSDAAEPSVAPASSRDTPADRSASPPAAEVEPLPIPIARLVPKLKKSAKLFEEGKKLIPNSTSSLIRVASYDPCPPFIARGKGPRIWDEDGNEYLDFNLAYGCLINGHAHPDMVKAVSQAAELGFHFASPTKLEIDLAKEFHKLVPNSERVAFCSNGSDATMNAMRIARAVTGKDVILKFEGHYHGQHDYALISAEAPPIVAGLDEYPRPMPNSAGSAGCHGLRHGRAVQFDHLVRAHDQALPDRLAAVILEPIMANAGVIPPIPDYLQRLREITRENDLLLIFDEVFTGFRVAPGGAQQLYKVEPDLSCWAKALGGGVPISAVSGKAEYMDLISPVGSRSVGRTSRTTFPWPARSRT